MEAATPLRPVKDSEDGPAIAQLRPGQAFAGRYACTRKDRATARNGSPYLSVVLRDRSGAIAARIFRDVDRIGARFASGDAVEAQGKAEMFRGQLVAELEDVRRIEPETVESDRFLPSAYRDREELEGFLEHLSREVHDPGLAAVVQRVLFAEPIAAQFRRAPCTRAGHHSYLGGLLEHTVAVAMLAAETVQLHPRLDSDLLMAAALLHDVGKTREFTYGAEFGLSEEGRTLGHLQIGAEIIGAAAGGLSDERRVALLGCVLAHHGTDPLRARHFPSPEAIALYRLNTLDAHVKGGLENGLGLAR